MFFGKVYSVSYILFIFSMLVLKSQAMIHFSEMCLDQALTIHMSLIKGMCTYTSLESETDPTNDTSKETNSAVVSSDFFSGSFVDDIIPIKKSCPTFKNQ